MSAEELFEKSLSEVDRLIHEGSILGEPVEVNGCTIVPVFGYGFGFGAGFKGSDKTCQGGGAGAGGGLSPVALVLIDKDVKGIEGIRVVPVRKPGPVTEAINAIGEEILPKVVGMVKKIEESEEEKEEK
ncbi:MAG: sporulation protein [Methanomicrobiaceae archaeon]|nr:sporulation protein [Methanomicrobiaceae archaeon]